MVKGFQRGVLQEEPFAHVCQAEELKKNICSAKAKKCDGNPLIKMEGRERGTMVQRIITSYWAADACRDKSQASVWAHAVFLKGIIQ
jgi:hypothetical protein